MSATHESRLMTVPRNTVILSGDTPDRGNTMAAKPVLSLSKENLGRVYPAFLAD